MSSSPNRETTTDSAFVCDCGEDARSACAGETFYKKYEGKRYCVFHFPGNEKAIPFNKALKRKLKQNNLDFRDVWFPGELSFSQIHFKQKSDFTNATFNARVDFSSATFSQRTDFSSAKFVSEANFAHAVFPPMANFRYASFNEKVSFNTARFSTYADFRDTVFDAKADFRNVLFGTRAYFTRARFNADSAFNNTSFGTRTFFTNAIFNAKTDFESAAFKERAYFTKTTINGKAYFTYTSFESYVLFSGAEDKAVFNDNTALDFQFARIEKPERVSFHTLSLRPHWFVNIDTRKLDFVNVDWDWRNVSIAQEIESLKRKKISSPHRLLSVTCRNLAVNAEENHRYEEASRFRYWSMDVQRQGACRGFEKFRSLGWWYWLASGYGERVLQAFVTLIGIWLLFAVLYTQMGFVRWEPRRSSEKDAMTERRDEVGEPLGMTRSLAYSFGVMTLQKPEPRPATTAAQSFVVVEMVLGPLQGALLALAIRRKFMR